MPTTSKTPTIDREDPAQLEAGRALVVQCLEEAHATEAALVTTLQAHITMTPTGDYRALLDRHLGETRQHARAIERRLEELGAGSDLISAATGLARTLVGQLLALSKGPIDVLRGAGGEEKLLRNAKDECATEALEIATYDALEVAARAVGDAKTARLAAAHRSQEERMLAGLRELIPSLTHATVLARAGGEPSYDLFPSRIETLRADEPWDGYDDSSAGDVVARLSDADGATAAAVRTYEGAHQRRVPVLEAAQRRLAAS